MTIDVDFEMMMVGLTLVNVNKVFVSLTVTRCGVTVRVGLTVVDLGLLRKYKDFCVRIICLRFGYC